MTFADTAARTITSATGECKITLAGTVIYGDLLGYSSGWQRASGTGGIYAELIAGESGFSGEVVTAYRAATVSGFTGATADGVAYLSDTAGHYASSAGTYEQRVGKFVSATEAVISFTGEAELVNANIATTAAIACSKLGALASGKILLGNGSGVAAAVTPTGDVTITNAGVTAIGSGKVVTGNLSSTLKTGTIPLNIEAVRIIAANEIGVVNATDGGQVASDTAPAYKRINGATDKALQLTWIANGVGEVQFPPTVLPHDFDEASDITVNLIISKGSNTDTAAVMGVGVWVGKADTAVGGNTAALATASVTNYAVTVAAADLVAHPSFLTVTLTPGTHANDAVNVHAAYIEYTRK